VRMEQTSTELADVRGPSVGRSEPKPADQTADVETVDEATVLKVLQTPQTLRDIANILAQHGIGTSHPTLRLDIVAPSEPRLELELDADDLRTLFSSFGRIEAIDLLEPRKTSAQIVFGDIVTAFFAQQALHQHYLPTYRAWIHLKWCVDPHDSFPASTLQYTAPPPAPTFLPVPIQSQSQSQSHSQSPSPSPSQPHPQSQSHSQFQFQGYEQQRMGAYHKYTCKFEIQLQDTGSFKVARKLIGPRGCNMKQILRTCTVGCVGPVENTLKLRLRGQGSGFLEGPQKAESADPLHLCISSCYYEKYVLAKQLVAELINNVYNDYKRHCQELGKPRFVPPPIKLSENVTTRQANWDLIQSRANPRQQSLKPIPSRPDLTAACPKLKPTPQPGRGFPHPQATDSAHLPLSSSYPNPRAQPQSASLLSQPTPGHCCNDNGNGNSSSWNIDKLQGQVAPRLQHETPYTGQPSVKAPPPT
jgi:hypothetical protein